MATRAQLLKKNPLVIASRALVEANAINPDRVDLNTLRVEPAGDKSVQIRGEIMVTIPTTEFDQAYSDAQDQLTAEAEEVRRQAEEAEQEKTIGEQLEIAQPAPDDEGDDGF